MKRLLGLIALSLCFVLLCGCWSYQGLNDIDIVTGMAVDRDGANGNYILTFEIVDTQSAGSEGDRKTKYVEAEGETLFDAIRNSKKKLINKLYGGNMQTLIVSRQIAENEGVSVIVEELLRDGEPRETLSVAISQEESAKAILLSEGIDSKIISFGIHEMIKKDSQVTASTVNMPLYHAYNAIKGTANALVLPVMRCVVDGEKTVVEGNGTALFRGDRLAGFLSAQDSMLYLFAVNQIHGGVISFPAAESKESISMEITGSQTKTKVDYREGRLIVEMSIKLKLNVMEIKSQMDISQAQERSRLEDMTEEYLEARMTGFIQKIQSQYGMDIFGLGRILYKKNPNLWRSLEDQWDGLFQNAELYIQAQADVISSGVLQNY